MEAIRELLFELRDEGYAAFQAKLTPTVVPERFIGVRVPQVRALAKRLKNDARTEAFLKELPHQYYDEDMLHGLLISQIADFDEAIGELERFLPYVDNWAVCDVLSPKVFKKHKAELIGYIRKWISAEEAYTVRFGIEMLMSHYLDDDFKKEYPELVAGVKSGEYYVNMMIAWFFATALAKQWESIIPYVENRRLDPWTHNRTIQKAVESYRITEEQKAYLKTLRKGN